MCRLTARQEHAHPTDPQSAQTRVEQVAHGQTADRHEQAETESCSPAAGREDPDNRRTKQKIQGEPPHVAEPLGPLGPSHFCTHRRSVDEQADRLFADRR